MVRCLCGCILCYQEIFSESPWIAVLVFGVPTFVISLVCYAICCLAPADDEDTRPSSDDEADDSDLAECKPSRCLILCVTSKPLVLGTEVAEQIH